MGQPGMIECQAATRRWKEVDFIMIDGGTGGRQGGRSGSAEEDSQMSLQLLEFPLTKLAQKREYSSVLAQPARVHLELIRGGKRLRTRHGGGPNGHPLEPTAQEAL